ncbi:MAG: ABC transporter ATP-binding protein [Acidimicrobiales bacterium]|nr:ABC transporter ATP-binding protein [Acidimicrobiales bacterium]
MTPATDQHAAVTGEGITKRWGSTSVLEAASFRIGSGVTGLLGANGAGKTTLLGMILGLHRADSGTLTVLGHDPTALGAEVRARIGYSPEHHVLPPDMRAHDLVALIARVHGIPRRAATTRASDALWLVGLGEERYRAIGTMSTGQRQRVKLAQAIAHDPVLVLLDEPTDGLDPVQREEILALIRRIGTEFGIDVVLSSHLLDEVERVCDSVVILGNGGVLASGAIEDIRGDSTGIVAEVDDHLDLVAAALEAAGWIVAIDGTRLSVDLHPADVDRGLDAVRDAVSEANAPLRSLVPQRLSLEQVFLQELA